VSAIAVGARRVRALPRPSAATLVRGAAAGVVALLTAWAVHARTRDLGAPLWIDEGISLGIARHALTDIPGVLRQDGAPPLFYVLLHWCTAVFGVTARAGHAFSLACAAAAVPAAFWAARAPFGWTAGVVAAAIVALDPFAGLYAVEIRMYSMVLLVGVLATGMFLRAFVMAPGHRGWAAGFAVALAAMLYTHNWGIFLAGAAGIVWLVLLAADAPRRRGLLLSGLIGFGGAVLLFAPWMPTVLEQAKHTGAPWAHAPKGHSIAPAWRRMLGGDTPETALLLFAAAGLATMVRPWRRPAATALLVCAGLAVLTFALAFAWSNVASPAWASRYLTIVLAPAAIAIGAGLARTGPIAVLVLVVLFIGSWYGRPSHAQLGHKSNANVIAYRLAPSLPPGTTVFSTQPEQVPVLEFYLPPGLRYATPLGRVPDPRVMDWRDAMKRLDRPQAERTLGRLLRGLRPGERLLLVQPRFSHPDAPWTVRVRRLARKARRTLRANHHVRVIRRVIPKHGYSRATLSAQLLERVGGSHVARSGRP
jgi:mannosyltransferase